MERAVALALQALPLITAVCVGIFALVRYIISLRRSPQQSTPTPVQQGQVIPPPTDQWADRAYAGLQRELEDEIADHAHTINRHRICHESMRGAGLSVPDDH